MKAYTKPLVMTGAVLVLLGGLIFAAQRGPAAQDPSAAQNRGAGQQDAGQGVPEEAVMRAVYLEKEGGDGIFVNLEAEYPFYGTVPDGAVYDEAGGKIAAGDLNNGDVVDIYGNGMIAESYPAQYHGITEIRRTEQANREYIDRYGHYLDELFIEKDPSERPYLNVCYTDELAAVSVIIPESLSYTWTYEEDGESRTVTVDAPHVLQTSPTEVKKLAGPMQMELQFDEEPERIRIFSWDDALLGQEQEEAGQMPEGTAVEVSVNDNGNPEFTAQPGRVYLACGEWENGNADYAFRTPAVQE